MLNGIGDCLDVFFQLSSSGKEANGTHNTTLQSIMKHDRKDLYANILLSRGITTFNGIWRLLTSFLPA